jgi:hypothetical protein
MSAPFPDKESFSSLTRETAFAGLRISSPVCATCPADLILLDLIIVIRYGEQYKSVELFIMQFSPATFFFLCRHFQIPS